MVSLESIRSEVRRERKQREWSLDKLAEESDLDRATLHQFESVKKYPAHKPRLDTFCKAVFGLGLTFTDFFKRLEGTAVILSQDELKRVSGVLAQAPPDLLEQAKEAPRPPEPPTQQGRGSKPANAAAGRNRRVSGPRR